MIFWLVLKLEISYNRVIICGRILVSFRDFIFGGGEGDLSKYL
jgi:hypothetical protein